MQAVALRAEVATRSVSPPCVSGVAAGLVFTSAVFACVIVISEPTDSDDSSDVISDAGIIAG